MNKQNSDQPENTVRSPATVRERDIVIIGGGFAGLACARGLAGTGVSVLLVDRRNFHLFQPLLYQVATAALSPADIAEPIRKILRHAKNIDVAMDELVGIDTVGRLIHFAATAPVRYHRLVLATGSEYNYFGHNSWRRIAPGLKTIDDAREIRSRLLRNFEMAETCTYPLRQRSLMTAVVIGGGPTGVEMAGAIAELTRWTLARDFRHIDPAQARTILIEAGPRLLAAFPKDLADYAHRELESLGVAVRTGEAVQDMDETGVTAAGERIDAGLIVWGAGIRATSATRLVGAPLDPLGRLAVDSDLAVVGFPDIYALGDIAHLEQDGSPLPALAQVAKQQGEHLGAHLAAAMKSGRKIPPFRFRNRGNTAVIGRHSAVFDFGRRRMKGRLAWLLWAIVHVYLLVGFDKRLLVSTQWIWRYLTYQRGARIIGLIERQHDEA